MSKNSGLGEVFIVLISSLPFAGALNSVCRRTVSPEVVWMAR